MSVLDEIRPEWDALKEAVKDVVALNAELCAEVKRLRKYTRTLESANLDVTARLQDYIGQYDPTDAFVAEVKAENAKLRELCRRFSEYVSYDRCEGCVTKRRCNDGEVDECWQMGEIRKLARELGIEVSDAS